MTSNTRRVLIADGDARVRQELATALLAANIFSDGAATTAAAEAKLREETYGVVVLDVTLPPGNVEAAVERIAQMRTRSRPVVLALASNPETARTLNVDIVQIVLRRPVQLRQVVDIVQSCLRSVEAYGDDGPRADVNSDSLVS